MSQASKKQSSASTATPKTTSSSSNLSSLQTKPKVIVITPPTPETLTSKDQNPKQKVEIQNQTKSQQSKTQESESKVKAEAEEMEASVDTSKAVVIPTKAALKEYPVDVGKVESESEPEIKKKKTGNDEDMGAVEMEISSSSSSSSEDEIVPATSDEETAPSKVVTTTKPRLTPLNIKVANARAINKINENNKNNEKNDNATKVDPSDEDICGKFGKNEKPSELIKPPFNFTGAISNSNSTSTNASTNASTHTSTNALDNEPVLEFVLLTDNAVTPQRGSTRAAGYDLCSAYDLVVPSHDKAIVPTDIAIRLPKNCYGRVAPRSGLAAKHFLDVGAGVIDEDYRGNIGVILFNHGSKDFKISHGDRIAQLICERIYYPKLVEVASLDHTERGDGGFGSTGI